MNVEDITNDDFQAYENVRKSGVTNMYSYDVQTLAGIDQDTHLAIIEHYDELCKRFPDVRTLEG